VNVLDAAGNRTAKTDDLAGVTSNYTYDKIYELTQVTQGTNTTESYSFDPVGNRTSSLAIPSYTVNSSNELTSDSNASYTYDNNGNTLTEANSTGTTSYAWDFENRLTQVTLPNSGGTVTFTYDPFGRRIEKVSPTATSIFVYDGDNLVETVNGSGGEVASYAQGQNIDEPLAMDRSGTIDYYEQDGLGSVTSLTATNGSVAQSYTYDSFGNQTASSGSLTNYFRYTGREFDKETNLYYYRARYYDPTSGRFLSEDPSRFNTDFDFYRYVFDNPVDFGDPLGLQGSTGGNANTWTAGEIGSWTIGPAPNYLPPPNLGDAKTSIGAACALNGDMCNSVDWSNSTNPADQAAWNNIVNANGADRSGGGNFMCVNGQGCWFVHRCFKCVDGKQTPTERPKPLAPSGSLSVGGKGTIYFYKDPLKGWCNAADYKSACKCNK
jgi:RHS repeat-associated protein